MKVFVTGASGYIGSVVAELLTNSGHEVTGLARSAAAAAKLQAAGVAVFEGSLADPAGLARAAQSADAVIHCAMADSAETGALDRTAVAAMLSALAGSGKAFVYTSGVWVYGDTRDRMLGEIARLNPPPLVAWRPAVEELVLEARDRGVKSMVLRPGMVFGRQGGTCSLWYDSAAKEKVIRVIGDGQNHWSAVHVDDLADLYRRTVEEPVSGELFLACSGMPQRVKKLAEAVQRYSGEGVTIQYVPLAEAPASMGPAAACLAMDIKTGSTKAVRFFGWGPRKPNITAVLEQGNQ